MFAIGASPILVYAGLQAAPYIITSYLSNPMGWNSVAAEVMMGSAGYDAAGPGALLESSAAKTGAKLANNAVDGSSVLIDEAVEVTLRHEGFGIEKASDELISKVASKRNVMIVEEGTDELRYLE